MTLVGKTPDKKRGSRQAGISAKRSRAQIKNYEPKVISWQTTRRARVHLRPFAAYPYKAVLSPSLSLSFSLFPSLLLFPFFFSLSFLATRVYLNGARAGAFRFPRRRLKRLVRLPHVSSFFAAVNYAKVKRPTRFLSPFTRDRGLHLSPWDIGRTAAPPACDAFTWLARLFPVLDFTPEPRTIRQSSSICRHVMWN